MPFTQGAWEVLIMLVSSVTAVLRHPEIVACLYCHMLAVLCKNVTKKQPADSRLDNIAAFDYICLYV